jgi:membrane protease YdiL (CAAX protease family)
MLDLSLQRDGMNAAVANDLSYLVVPPILLVLMFPYLRRCRDALGQLFARHRLTLRVVLCSVALGLTLRLMWWASTTFLIGIGVLGNQDPNATVGPLIGFECPPLPVLALSLFVMSGLIPIFEEVVHRGYLLHALVPRGTLLAVMLSALIFGLMHRFPYVTAFTVGAFLAVQTLNYGALWGPIITHATFNGAAVFDWDCFRIIWNPAASDPVLSQLTWASVPIMIGSIFLAAFLATRKWPETLAAPRHT